MARQKLVFGSVSTDRRQRRQEIEHGGSQANSLEPTLVGTAWRPGVTGACVPIPQGADRTQIRPRLRRPSLCVCQVRSVKKVQ